MTPRIEQDFSKEFDLIKIGLASPEKILQWSHGEVEKPETINYRTFKPERRGLFCEKIFGPVKDWECHCGKYRRVRYRGIICERCGVEVTTSRVRRERMGHIKLSVPVSHVWFLRGIPSYIGALLDISTRPLEEVIYYDAYVVTDVSSDVSGLKAGQILREVEYQEAREKFGSKFKADMGAKPIKELLSRIDLSDMVKKLRKEFKDSVGQKRLKIIKRLRVAESFLASGNRPEWMIFDVIPVLPPDLRPMVQLEGGRFATSDLNDLYRRILNRNNRLKKMITMGAPDMIVRNERRMLQEAVDVLIDNGRRRRAVTGSTGKPLKSLTDIIEGKEGRFRQNLLGKRADYSGRSVIVVGPTLKIYQCGLPKEMALELFKPFVIRKLVERGFSQNVKNAKRQIERRDVVVWDMLEEVIKGHPVMLNRAPTLHRLGIQAFEPILVEGKAIQIHPLVCPAFNADFDGDQMAVHVPLLTEAQLEARLIMMASNNILSPASGRPIITPTQDMVVGTYYMTVMDEKHESGKGRVFSNEWEAMVANDLDEVELHAPVKVRLEDSIIETTIGRIKFNYTLKKTIMKKTGQSLEYINETVGKKKLELIIRECYSKFGTSVTADVADEVKRLGFKYATLGGITIAIEDLKIPDAKKDILERANKDTEHLEKLFQQKLISGKEKFIRSLDIWSNVTEKVTDAMLEGFDKLNSVYMMVFSGARGSLQQVRQLAGIRGLMADPSGNIINIPIKTNFKEGLNITEYFISSYGARKGLVDTALRTADSGYLTRRLVDVAQDVVISEDDCGTEDGMEISSIREGFEEIIPLSIRLVYRIPVSNVTDPITKKVIAKAGEEISEEKAVEIYAAGIEYVRVRSTLTCKTKRGLCKKCYGRDLSSASEINMGEAVGIIAAQSIGEPGTQLTMRTFHIGGVALHKTSMISIKTRHGGKVKIIEGLEASNTVDHVGKKVALVTRETKILIKVKEREEEYIVPVGSVIKVSNGDSVEAGAVLAEFDPAYEYVVSSTHGKVKFLSLEVIERSRKVGDKTITDYLAKNDADVFVYSPKLVRPFELPSDNKPIVKIGSVLRVGDEIAAGVASKIAGHVIEIRETKSKNLVEIVPGETYSILAGSRMNVADGDEIKEYALISTVETIRRDPSKTRDIIQGLPRVEELFEARRPKDPAILSDIDGEVEIAEKEGIRQVVIRGGRGEKREYLVSYDTRLRVARGDRISAGAQITYGTVNSHDVLRILGVRAVQMHLVDEIQKIYRSQGVTINDKHIEVIVRQMTSKIRVFKHGNTILLPGELIDKGELDKINKNVEGEKADGINVLLGITKASLSTESFISAASFQETARVLTDAAIKGKTDLMFGLKENVIIGKLIPAGTGFESYRFVDVSPETADKS